MRPVYTIIFMLFIGIITLSCSCPESGNDEGSLLYNEIHIPETASSLSVSGDSTNLFIAGHQASFYKLNISENTVVKFKLPLTLDQSKTYQILQLSEQEFLISKRNQGVTYLRYSNNDSNFVFYPEKTVYLSSDTSKHIYPQKRTNYSSYQMIVTPDSSILFGSSNGLMVFSKERLDSVRSTNVSDSVTAIVPYTKALFKFRQGVNQFAIEELLLDWNTSQTIAITDRGIYRLSPDLSHEDKLSDGRFWSGYIDNDTLFAVGEIDNKTQIIKVHNPFSVEHHMCGSEDLKHVCQVLRHEITGFSNGYATINGRDYDLNLSIEGKESIKKIGDNIYYIANGDIRYINSHILKTVCSMNFPQVITTAKEDNGLIYVLNEKGLYSINEDNEQTYLGEVNGLPKIKDAIWHDGDIYVCDDISVYRLSAKDLHFAYDRNVEKIANINIKTPDRIECLSSLSDGSGIIIGTRRCLKKYILSDGSLHDFSSFDNPDSPYFTDILTAENYLLFASTLNHGIFKITDKNNNVNTLLYGDNLKNVRAIDLNGKFLLIVAPSSVKIADISGPEYSELGNLNIENISAAKFIGKDSIRIITPDHLMLYRIADNSLQKISEEPNPTKYNHIETINNKEFLISDFSIANAQYISATNIDWITILFYSVIAIILIFALLFVLNHIKSINRKYTSYISYIKQLHESKKRELINEHAQSINKLNRQHQSEKQELVEEHAKSIAELNTHYQSEKQVLAEELEQRKNVEERLSKIKFLSDKEKSLKIMLLNRDALKTAESNIDESLLEKLVSLIKLFEVFCNKINNLSQSNDTKPGDITTAIQTLAKSVKQWFNIDENSINDAECIKCCRYGLQILNMHPHIITSLSDFSRKPDSEPKNDSANKLKRDMVWELFIRFVFGKEFKINDVINDIITQYKDIVKGHNSKVKESKSKTEKTIDKDTLYKYLKERIHHSNIGSITNYMLHNLSHDFWNFSSDKQIEDATTPYDILWISYELNKNQKLINELDEAAKKLSKKANINDIVI